MCTVSVYRGIGGKVCCSIMENETMVIGTCSSDSKSVLDIISGYLSASSAKCEIKKMPDDSLPASDNIYEREWREFYQVFISIVRHYNEQFVHQSCIL